MDTFIINFARFDLLDYSEHLPISYSAPVTYLTMLVNKYWVNQGAPNRDFWAHEVRMVVPYSDASSESLL